MNEFSASAATVFSSALADILDELADRLADGDDVDLAPYLERLPEQAEPLKEAAEALRQMFQLRNQLSGGLWQTDPTQASLGDFRLLREIGRGGMGVVYEAEQMSLRRRVAVKILPFAALLNSRQLERFQNEARAAGMLKHPNIVSVHSVGCQRGFHYYVMDLIEGGTLANVIDQLGTSAPFPREREERHPADTRPIAQWTTDYSRAPEKYCREVARVGAILADAIQYAHEQGVTHRDLKPSNLLLDQQGNPWITDFGLANVQGNPALTMTGDRLGTLRYMSPEQANGHKLLDHRTDIYSLGATLYELLTLRPAFDSDDRAQLIRQLADEQPTPIRTLARHVPRDLETIVMKAMAKRPDDRYESAAELADDLRRFQQQKPVRARRSSWLHRAKCWSVRHRLQAATLASTLVLLIILSMAGPPVAWKYARLATSEATARQSAEQVREELQALLGDTLTTTTETLENTPSIDPLHRKLIDDTLNHYERLLALDGNDPRLRLEAAKAYVRLGKVTGLRFDADIQMQLVHRGIELLEDLAKSNSADARVQVELASAYFQIGATRWEAGPMQRGLKISEELVRRFPETLNYQYVLGWCQQYLARIIGGDSHFSDAEQLIRQSEIIFHRLSKLEPDNCDYRFGLASSLRCVGLIHLEMGHFDRADAELRESTELCVPIENDLFRETRGKIDYATILQDRGVVLLQMRESNEAELWLRRSVDILTAIVDGFPGSDWACAELCRSQTWLADSLVAQGRIVDAESVYRQAVVNWNRHILQGRCLGEQAWTRDHLGQLLWHNGNVDESRTEFRAALSLAEQAGDHILLASSYANCPETSLRSPEQAVAHAQLVSERDMRRWRLLGVAYYRTGDYEAAADALRKMVEQPIGDSFDSFFLAMSYSHLDEPAAAARWYDNGLSRINRPSLTEIDRIEAAHVEATQEVGSRQGDVNLQN